MTEEVKIPNVGDRVIRKSRISGCHGTVLKCEIGRFSVTKTEYPPDDYHIKIKWDNGTESYVSASALEIL